MAQVIKIKVKVKGQPQELTYFLDWDEYRVQANWMARLEGKRIPYPEIESLPRPEIKGTGLMEQIQTCFKKVIK